MELTNHDITVHLKNGDSVNLTIFPISGKKQVLWKINESDAIEYGESSYQILEGCRYEFEVSGTRYTIKEDQEIVAYSKKEISRGFITPGIYVGTISLSIIDRKTGEEFGKFPIEVLSLKTSYRKDYRFMLEEITEKCTDLLMQHSSPALQHFTFDFDQDWKTLYQRFAFLKSIIDSDEFLEAITRIIESPVKSWKEEEEEADIRKVRKISNSSIRQIVSRSNRIPLPDNHFLKPTLSSIPSKLTLFRKYETVDTPENRYIKHTLMVFSHFVSEIRHRLTENLRAYAEALSVEQMLGNILNHAFFKEISAPTTLPLNSPVLQRKEGYREVFRVWLNFDLAAKLCWKGGEDVYEAGKRDVAILYEYWLFFKLIDLLSAIFDIEPRSIADLIQTTSDGLGLKLKSGVNTVIEGVYDSEIRKLNVRFNYNKTFNDHKYPKGGSWSRQMRPDFTLSLWPLGFSEDEAEKQELITHIHFDAKYKVDQIEELVGKQTENLDEEKVEQKKGNYKRADLLKMHAYKDAIRRTSGAYILYPGTEEFIIKGFHEIIPGLGAFPIRPSKIDNGTTELKSFIEKVVNHFLDRASQRDNLSYHTFKIFEKEKDKNDAVNEPLPESYDNIRLVPPDDTTVLIGYCKSDEHHKWIKEKCLYNVRMNKDRGSLRLGPAEAGARYLILHSKGELITNEIWRIRNIGPLAYSKMKMIYEGYPDPKHESYLVYELEILSLDEFDGVYWDISKLKENELGYDFTIPFAVTLSNLMKVKIQP
ncbi:MAG: DUF2357 domain-containing protein [Bacteroidetes bacterium]|nr:DUF2357 domain-containing protein [Bacteroidota bacterium]